MRWAGPSLQDEPLLYECPTGYALREAPWVYGVMAMADRVDACSPSEWREMTPWSRSAVSVVVSERARMREEEQRQREAGRHG